MEAWIGLIGALLGSAIGGGTTYVISRQQHRHDTSMDLRRRLEAYELIHQLLSESAGRVSTLNILVLGDLGFGTKFDASKIKSEIQSDRFKCSLILCSVPQ